MTEESKQLSDLISDIYDVALDQSLWPDVLAKICAFVGGCGANLFSHDVASRSAAVHVQWGNDPHYQQLYLEEYIKLNPLVPSLTFYDVGVVFSQSDLVSYEEFEETRFYKEWVRPQGIVDVIGANLEKSATASAMLAIRRGTCHGRIDDKARRRMTLVVPHIRRAVLIGNILDSHKAEAATLTVTLKGLSDAVFLVDARGSIIFVNAAGEALLEDGKILRGPRGILAAVDAKANLSLQEAFAAAGSGDAAVGVKGIAVPLPFPGDERWLAHVLPLSAGARKQSGSLPGAAAAVFVRAASLGTPTALETTAKLYKLTATEVRVLQAVVEVGGAPAIASALGISETTVKTHLQNLFGKTGARRQADLVKLLAAAASPFAS